MLSKVLAHAAKNVGDRLELAADDDMAWGGNPAHKNSKSVI